MKWPPITFLVAICAFLDSVEAAGPPNVLFIAVDDLRPALNCYGDRTAKTPSIDGLAKQSTVFLRAYCQQAVCCPSRLSMLTGMRPDTIRVWDLKTHFRDHKPNAVSLPQLFRQHGYHTQSIGKILHGSGSPSKDPPSWSEAPQFDSVRDPNLRYALPVNLAGEGLKRSAAESADVPDHHYVDGLVCNAALKALSKRAADKSPFFLAVGFRKPHLPFCAPQKYWDLYDRDKIPRPLVTQAPDGAPELATRSWGELEGYSDIPKNGQITPEKIQELRHGYYACISYIDAQIGRLLKQLQELELDDSTIIVLWGDHGFHLGEQGLWTKANNYELSTRIPLLLSAPKHHKTANSTALVEVIDIYPTLAELCNLPIPAAVEGRSLVPVLKNPQQPFKSAAISQYPRMKQGNRHKSHGDIMGYTVRTPNWRYVRWQEWKTNKLIAEELYDMQRGQLESRNLAGSREYRATVQRMQKFLSHP